MNILIVRHASRNDFGGAETYAYNLSKALKVNNHRPLLITSLSPLIQKCRDNHIPVKRGPWKQSQEWNRLYYLRYAATTLWYCWQILVHRIDVVNPQGRDDFVFATTAAWLMRKPVVWTDHADLKYILDRQNRPNRRLQSWVLSAAKKTQAIICVSESEKSEISRVAPELTNLEVVHNGVFKPVHVEAVVKPAGISLIVGTNARLVAAKGIRELIDGFAKSSVAATGQLWIVGSENDDRQDYYNYAAQLNVASAVKFWGYVTNPNDYVSAMNIFVHASYHEAFSLAIIEAAMLGKAIIATNVGGTPEIIDTNCGLLIPPKDSDAITKAIDILANNEALRLQLGRAAQSKALNQFDFDAIVKTKLIPLYLGEL